MMHMNTMRTIEYLNTLRRIVDSPPARPMAVAATVRDWGEIILPTTPPAALDPTSSCRMPSTPRAEASPICWPTFDWSPEKRMFAEVSEPVT